MIYNFLICQHYICLCGLQPLPEELLIGFYSAIQQFFGNTTSVSTRLEQTVASSRKKRSGSAFTQTRSSLIGRTGRLFHSFKSDSFVRYRSSSRETATLWSFPASGGAGFHIQSDVLPFRWACSERPRSQTRWATLKLHLQICQPQFISDGSL